jgi:hypothetical protein
MALLRIIPGIMETFPAVTTIAQTIQLSLSPVFMLAGIAGVLNLLAGRLSRVIDRARALEQLHPGTAGRERDRHVAELRLLDRRMRGINVALFLCTGSAIATCAVVALLFVGELATLKIGTIVALTFILAMLMLVAGLVMFVLEVRLSIRATRIRGELLQ